MRIIILNQFFYPDHSATSQLMTDLAESLVERGVEVTALSGRGRYNGGTRLAPREAHRGVKIERAWATGFGKRSVAGRLSDYLSFYLGSAWKLLTLPQHDILMALTTPPLIGLLALLIGHARGMKVVTLVQDVYPDVAVALGVLQLGNPLTRLLDSLGRFVLRRSDRIIVLGERMRERIGAKIGSNCCARIDVIHNWADGANIKPLGDGVNPFAGEHNLRDSFVVLFSGNLGRVNEFSTVLEAARLLADDPGIQFIFIGDGTRASEIETFIDNHNLANVRMLPYQPRELLPYSLAAGHAHLVTLADGLAGLSVPSKTYGILAAGRPVLFVGDPQSDIARLVVENNCGASVASGDSMRLAQIIREWALHRDRLAELGIAARRLFETHFDRPHAVNSYLKTFAQCLDAAPSHTGSIPAD